MKKYIGIIAVVAALIGVAYSQSSIDVMINDLDFKGEVIETVNALVADKDAGVTFTNTVAAAVTNLSIVVIEGKVTSVTINGSTTP